MDYHDPAKRSIANELNDSFDGWNDFRSSPCRISFRTSSPPGRGFAVAVSEVRDEREHAIQSKADNRDPGSINGCG